MPINLLLTCVFEEALYSIVVRVSDLVPSPFNVRRHPRTSVEELAALIDSQGLLHPLTVNEHEVGRGRSRRVKFAVPAGERRRRALLLLRERGRLPADHEVACKLVPPERALAVSVAENSAREPMHPADEFEAFKALVDEGKGIEDVAVARDRVGRHEEGRAREHCRRTAAREALPVALRSTAT